MKKLKIYPIGTKVFLTHKKWKDKKISGGRVIPCKVKSYENIGGNIIPICSEIGASKNTYTTNIHYLHISIEEAVLAISTDDLDIELIENTITIRNSITTNKKEMIKLAAMKSLIASTRNFDDNFIKNIENWSELIAEEFVKQFKKEKDEENNNVKRMFADCNIVQKK